MECPPLANFHQILISINKPEPILFAFLPIGDAITEISAPARIEENVCGDGKKMKGFPTFSFLYEYAFLF
jgi:hypothetical protein